MRVIDKPSKNALHSEYLPIENAYESHYIRTKGMRYLSEIRATSIGES